ncbi:MULTISPECIES: hypothetical protein [Burkholderiaceae]|uniref:hypothetical protein n=1 Tax=Burkholderiaceae TaxID=119060 RepID=UPI00097746F7|nr:MULTISPECIES: hypothetical protein [Burkholderiaceae]MCG1017353.1 hypothetical protein [Mycetohabitans sp. B4]
MTITTGPRRTPRGMLSGRFVYVGLTSAERAELEQIAADHHRSISSMARELISVGKRHFNATSTPSQTPVRS